MSKYSIVFLDKKYIKQTRDTKQTKDIKKIRDTRQTRGKQKVISMKKFQQYFILNPEQLVDP